MGQFPWGLMDICDPREQPVYLHIGDLLSVDSAVKLFWNGGRAIVAVLLGPSGVG